MTSASPPPQRTATPDTAVQSLAERGRRRVLVRVLGVVGLLFVLALLLAPQWGRPLLADALKKALVAQGWQEVELQVAALGLTQARVSHLRMQSPQAGIEVAEIAVTFSPYELLAHGRVKGIIASHAKVQAHFAEQMAGLVAAPLLLQWPEQGKPLPFERIYLNDVQILPQPSAGVAALSLSGVLEQVPGRTDSLRLWVQAQTKAPHAHAAFSAEIDLKQKTLKGTLDSEFTDLSQWRRVPLPPQASGLLDVVRERLTLQGGVSIKNRNSLNWMLFGQSPAAVYTAPNGIHVEAIDVDFGFNVIGADQLDYGWLRAASGAAQSPEGSIEWNTLRAELKPSQYFTAHAQSALLRADISSMARELMPPQQIWRELSGAWRTQAWQAQDLSASLFARDNSKNRPPFLRFAGELKFGPLEYPWEKIEPLSYTLQEELLQIPLLRPLIEGQPAEAGAVPTTIPPPGSDHPAGNGLINDDGENDFGGLTLPAPRN